MFDFPATVAELTDIPEQYQALYDAVEDGYQLTESLSVRFAAEGQEQEVEGLRRENADLATQLQEKEQELTGLIARHDEQQLEIVVRHAIREAKGIEVLLWPHVRGQVGFCEQEEGRVLCVLDETGDPRHLDDGHPFGLEDLLQEMKSSTTFSRAFDGENVSGGGMSPSGNSGSINRINRQDQTAVNSHIEQIAAGTVSVS
ncbi:MAG: hypothetical protein ABJN40_12935 [Sneathiella sp.]